MRKLACALGIPLNADKLHGALRAGRSVGFLTRDKALVAAISNFRRGEAQWHFVCIFQLPNDTKFFARYSCATVDDGVSKLKREDRKVRVNKPGRKVG